MKRINIFFLVCFLFPVHTSAQQILETGNGKMPNKWIDKDTHHKVVKLSAGMEGNNLSFYFHNNPFFGNKMVFYNSRKPNPNEVTDIRKFETFKMGANNKQLYTINLTAKKIKQLTFHSLPMNGEVVSEKTKTVFYQIKDSVFSIHLPTKKVNLVYVFPKDFFKAGITTVNADGTLLAGLRSTVGEELILKGDPYNSDFYHLIYAANLPKTIFTINIKTGQLNKIITDSVWFNHVQFSPVNPSLLMFCHEGNWHEVDRIWTIDVNTKQVKQIHHRTMKMEIWGHEWFGKSGKTIWFDLQLPRGETFFVGGYDVASGKEIKYSLQRNEWSVHFNTNSTETLFAGDGGEPGSVAKAPDGQWIYLYKPNVDKFISEKLVNMKYHQYKKNEPNVQFSPNGKWIIFRANFEGEDNVYAVEAKKRGTSRIKP